MIKIQINMIRSVATALVCMLSMASFAQNKVLVFSKTAGFRHGSIPTGKLALMQLGKENGFSVDTTENAEAFNENNLKQYNRRCAQPLPAGGI
jgi:cytochrome c